MKFPELLIDLDKIKHNADTIVGMCRGRGIRVVGVTKVVCADPPIIQLLLESGIHKLVDSRMQNIIKLRKAGFQCEIALLRIPMISEASEAVEYADVSYHSELEVIRSFNEAAKKRGKIHKIIIMVEAGDLREGILPEEAVELTGKIVESFSHIRLEGLAMNVGCYGGVLPSYENTSLLVRLRNEIVERHALRLPILSIGGSACLQLIESGQIPPEINEVRLGEAIFLGSSTVSEISVTDGYEDAFELRAEIVELRNKPSVPTGKVNKDGFGKKRKFADKGVRRRAILAIGRQDVPYEAIAPRMPGIEILGANSDHMVVDVTDNPYPVRVGDKLPFLPDYGGLLTLMTSPYVIKTYKPALRHEQA